MEAVIPHGIGDVNAHRNEGRAHDYLVGKHAPTRATQRYRLLIDQLRHEYPGISQSKLAERLGVGQPMVSKVLNSSAGVGVEALEAAMRTLHLQPAFFFERFPRDPHYSECLRMRTILPPGGYAAMQDFLKLIETSGDKLTEQERHALEIQEWPGEPTVQTYVMFLQCLRTLKPSDTAVTRRHAKAG